MTFSKKSQNAVHAEAKHPNEQGFWKKLFHKTITKITTGLIGFFLLGLRIYCTSDQNPKLLVADSINGSKKRAITKDSAKNNIDSGKSANKVLTTTNLKPMQRGSIGRTRHDKSSRKDTAITNNNKNPNLTNVPSIPPIFTFSKKDSAENKPLNECDITAISKYSQNVNQGAFGESTTGEILVYTYCEKCNFKVKVDNEEHPFDVVFMPKTRKADTYGYLPNEYEAGKHSIEIIDKRNNCHRVFPAFTVKGNMAIHICIIESPQ